MTAVIQGTDIEIPLPPGPLRLMNDDDERFVSHGVQLAKLVQRLGLERDDELLDVGCSVGRLAVGLLAGTDFRGRYVGFDVMRKQVRWAKQNLAPLDERLVFRYVDVRNARYNPKGTVEPKDLTFPARTGGFHMATLFSIFTHFYKEDVALYLRELRRTVRPGGRIVASWFLYDEARHDAVMASKYPMTFRLDDVTLYNDEADPLRAIAFHEDFVLRQIAEAGLEVERIEHGKWAGGEGPEFQDHIVIRRPVDPPPSFAERARNKIRRTFSRG